MAYGKGKNQSDPRKMPPFLKLCNECQTARMSFADCFITNQIKTIGLRQSSLLFFFNQAL